MKRPALLASLMLAGCSSDGCPFEKFQDSPHIRISQSPWIVDTWGQACGFGVSGGMEVRAAIEDTQETKTIVAFGDIITNLTVRSDEPNVLTIRLPNLVDMTDPAAQFGDVRVVYEFTPKDDPEARASFQKWSRDRGDPQARDWYCRTIFAKSDPAGRVGWNEVMGRMYSADHEDQRYCPDQ